FFFSSRRRHTRCLSDWSSDVCSSDLRLEPELNCVAALLSPSTGIIDSHALMLAYQGEAEDAGAVVVFRSPVLSGRVRGAGFELRSEEHTSELQSLRHLVCRLLLEKKK